MPRLKLITAKGKGPDHAPSEIETLFITSAQQAYLGRQSKGLNPDMPIAFGAAHVVRTLLDRIEQSGADLTDASSEEELTRVAADGLRRRRETQRRSRG